MNIVSALSLLQTCQYYHSLIIFGGSQHFEMFSTVSNITVLGNNKDTNKDFII